jgi:hypothetical protein
MKQQLQEKPAEGLSADEVRIFDMMEDQDQDAFWSDDSYDLRSWFTKAVRQYLASGCDPVELRQAMRHMTDVASRACSDWAAIQKEILEGPNGPKSPDEIAEANAEIAACKSIMERLENGRERLVLYAFEDLDES